MAIHHLSVKTVSRSAGRSAVAAAAYRTGERLTHRGTGEAVAEAVHDYSRRSGVVATALLLPDGAGGIERLEGCGFTARREELWNAAEAAERRVNSTVAREYEVALPAELDAEGHLRLAAAFAAELVLRYGVAADVAIHAPSRDGDQRNWHAHILTTTRVVEVDGLLGAKTRVLDDRKTGPAEVEALREMWARSVNQMLAWAGSEARVDHRSHERRGLTTRPGIHLGPTATGIERRVEREHAERDGGPDVPAPVTDRGQRQAAIDEANRAEVARLARLAEQAAAAVAAGVAARAAAERAERERVERRWRAEAAARAEAEMAAKAARKPVERPPAPAAPELFPISQTAPRPSQAPRQGISERERWWSLPLEALRREVEGLRPATAEELVERLPEVQAEQRARSEALTAAAQASTRAWRAGEEARRLEREIEEVHAEPGGLFARLGVRLHDWGLHRSAALVQREAALAEERRRQGEARQAEARHQAEAKAAKARERAAKAAGLPAIEAELRPARALHEAVAAVLREREALERLEARGEGVGHLASLLEQANANQRRMLEREAAREAEERERRAEAAREATAAKKPQQDQELDDEQDPYDPDLWG